MVKKWVWKKVCWMNYKEMRIQIINYNNCLASIKSVVNRLLRYCLAVSLTDNRRMLESSVKAEKGKKNVKFEKVKKDNDKLT